MSQGETTCLKNLFIFKHGKVDKYTKRLTNCVKNAIIKINKYKKNYKDNWEYR